MKIINNYKLLILLAIINIIFRLPITPTEVGNDSYAVHAASNSITTYGIALWVINPLSFIGVYPSSTSSAVPFLLSGISQTINLEMMQVILFFSMIVGLIGMITMYLLAREIKTDDFCAMITAFSYSLSPLFLRDTFWTTTTRNLFIALLPLFIWCLLKYRNKNSNKPLLIGLIILLFLLLATIHHMFFLIIGILIAYFGAYIFINSEFNVIIFGKRIRLAIALWLALFTIFIILQIYGLSVYNGLNISTRYQSGFLTTGKDGYKIFLNMAVNYFSNTGILILFGLLGILLVMLEKKKSFNGVFLSTTLLIFSPVITMGTYLIPFLLPFICLLIGFGFTKFIEFTKSHKIRNSYQITNLLVALCLIVSVIFSGFMIWRWTLGPNFKDINYAKEEIENVAFFIKDNKIKNSSFATNSGIFARQVNALSNTPIAPNYETEFFTFINKTELIVERQNFSPANYLKPHNIYRFNMSKYGTYAQFVSNRYDQDPSKNMIDIYHIKYLVEDNKLPGRMYSSDTGPVLVYPLFMSIHENTSKIYNGQLASIYYLGN